MKGFVDSNLVLSDAQAITVTASSTNYVKLPNTTVGNGQPLYVHLSVETAFASTSATIAVALQDGATASFAATEIALAATAVSSLQTVGTEWVWALPPDTKQFVQLKYTVATPSAATGKFDAYISDHP